MNYLAMISYPAWAISIRGSPSGKVYVMGDAHTNTIEGFWSLVKRGISGVNHAVSKKYLQDYLNEYAFRYNRRQDEQPMFEAFLTQVVAVLK
jgi:transposase-like protein